MAKLDMTTWSQFNIDRSGQALVTRAACRIAGVPGPEGIRDQVRDITLSDGSPGPDAPIAESDVAGALAALNSDHVAIVYMGGDCTANDSPYTPDAGMLTALQALFEDIPE